MDMMETGVAEVVPELCAGVAVSQRDKTVYPATFGFAALPE
jgi:hypothetical protein